MAECEYFKLSKLSLSVKKRVFDRKPKKLPLGWCTHQESKHAKKYVLKCNGDTNSDFCQIDMK